MVDVVRIALHYLVDVDADRWAAEHGIDRRDVRVHIRRQVAAELRNLRVPLVPVSVDKPSSPPPPAPASAATLPAAGPERAPAARPGGWAGRLTPDAWRAAAAARPGVGVRDAQPAGATVAPRERVSAARPADGTTPAPAPAARAGSTSGQPPAGAEAPRPSAGATRTPSSAPVALAGTRSGPLGGSASSVPARDERGRAPTADRAGTSEPAVASRHTVPALAAPHPGSPGTSGRPEPGTLRPAAPGPDRLLTGPGRAAGGYLERVDQHPAHPRNRRRLLAAVVALIVALVLAAATAGPGPAGPPAPPRPAPAPTAASRRTPPLPTPAPQPDTAWMASAACKGQDLAEFYPGPGQPARGRRWCRGCTVRLDCLDWVMAVEPTYGRHGLWGGLIPQEREDIAAAWRQAGGLS